MRRRRQVGMVLMSAAALVVGVVEPAVSASAKANVQPVVAGTAAATASVLGVSPAVSGLTLTTTIGASSAAYQHAETQAQSATVDLGSLGLVLATSKFCGKSLLPSSSQPQPLIVDSESGPRHATHGAGGLGTQAVAVGSDPESASATTTTISESLPGVLSITGRSHAEVRYIAAREQLATSSVIEDVSLLGGKVRLEGMRWTASRTSGVTTSHSTHFSFGRVTVAGVPLSTPDAASASTIAVINRVLSPFGLSALLPSTSTNQKTGAVAIGPFTVRFSGSTIERQVLHPAVGAAVSVENLIRALGSEGDNCKSVRVLINNLGDNTDTLLNVGLGISEGAGALDVHLGGVAAAVQDSSTYANPLGGGSTLGVTPGGAPGTAAVGPASALPTSTNAVTGASTASPPIVQSASVRCVSASPSRAHGCWRGVATVASASALALGATLLVADAVLTRRRRNNSRSAAASE